MLQLKARHGLSERVLQHFDGFERGIYPESRGLTELLCCPPPGLADRRASPEVWADMDESLKVPHPLGIVQALYLFPSAPLHGFLPSAALRCDGGFFIQICNCHSNCLVVLWPELDWCGLQGIGTN